MDCNSYIKNKHCKVDFYFDKEDKKIIKKKLIDKNLTMLKLADKLGISYSYFSKIVAGSRKISPQIYRKMIKLGLFD